MFTISKTAYFSKVALFIHVNKLSDNSMWQKMSEEIILDATKLDI